MLCMFKIVLFQERVVFLHSDAWFELSLELLYCVRLMHYCINGTLCYGLCMWYWTIVITSFDFFLLTMPSFSILESTLHLRYLLLCFTYLQLNSGLSMLSQTTVSHPICFCFFNFCVLRSFVSFGLLYWKVLFLLLCVSLYTVDVFKVCKT